ncbi:MAG: palmitoyltransferase swf1 [Sclerophora amabilis]|nr:MAG: palmitoyltransferase swf1 [Sclerophora amabilis]
MTAPLALGFLGYHVYEVWAGMTSNESAKWSDLGLDMADGYVFKRSGQRLVGDPRGINSQRQYTGDPRAESPVHSHEDLEPNTSWPLSRDQIIMRTEDGKRPSSSSLNGDSTPSDDGWKRVWHLSDVINLYDLGFIDNLMDVFNERRAFAGGRMLGLDSVTPLSVNILSNVQDEPFIIASLNGGKNARLYLPLQSHMTLGLDDKDGASVMAYISPQQFQSS